MGLLNKKIKLIGLVIIIILIFIFLFLVFHPISASASSKDFNLETNQLTKYNHVLQNSGELNLINKVINKTNKKSNKPKEIRIIKNKTKIYNKTILNSKFFKCNHQLVAIKDIISEDGTKINYIKIKPQILNEDDLKEYVKERVTVLHKLSKIFSENKKIKTTITLNKPINMNEYLQLVRDYSIEPKRLYYSSTIGSGLYSPTQENILPSKKDIKLLEEKYTKIYNNENLLNNNSKFKLIENITELIGVIPIENAKKLLLNPKIFLVDAGPILSIDEYQKNESLIINQGGISYEYKKFADINYDYTSYEESFNSYCKLSKEPIDIDPHDCSGWRPDYEDVGPPYIWYDDGNSLWLYNDFKWDMDDPLQSVCYSSCDDELGSCCIIPGVSFDSWYFHEIRREPKEKDIMDWAGFVYHNLPSPSYEEAEEVTGTDYWSWACFMEECDEEFEVYTRDAHEIQGNKGYYVDVKFNKNVDGSCEDNELTIESEYSDNCNSIPEGWCTIAKSNCDGCGFKDCNANDFDKYEDFELSMSGMESCNYFNDADDGWYRIDANKNFKVTLSVPSGADFDLYVRKGCGSGDICVSNEPGSADEECLIDVSTYGTGEYYIRIDRWSGGGYFSLFTDECSPEVCNDGEDNDCDGYTDCADADCTQGASSPNGFCCGSGCNVNSGSCVDASVSGFTCADGNCNTYEEVCCDGNLQRTLQCLGTSLYCIGGQGSCKHDCGAPEWCDEVSPWDREDSPGPYDELQCEISGTDCYYEAEENYDAPHDCDERGENVCSGTSGFQCEWTGTHGDNVIEECESDCGAISQCDEQNPGDGYANCTTAGETYFADQCSTLCQAEERTDKICRNSTFAAGCTADPKCNDIEAGTGNCSLTCTNIAQDSPPSVALISPADNSVDEDGTVTFNCSATDDNNLINVTIYGSWAGGWHADEIKSLSGTSDSVTFTKSLSNGIYIWNCLTYDNSSQSDWGNANYTINISILNTAPTNSTMLHPNGGEIFDSFAIINWSQSIDEPDDYVKYFLQYSNDSGVTWFDIISDYGFEDGFSDSSTEKIFTFTEAGNKTDYIRLPKEAIVTKACLNIEGVF